MTLTYSVRINSTEVWEGARKTTHWVRWTVNKHRWKEPFATAPLAESFRSELVRAAKTGEAFDTETGRPVSMGRRESDVSWYQFACKYAAMKWPRAAATTRRSTAEALVTITMALLSSERGMPPAVSVRSALLNVAFNISSRPTDENAPVSSPELRWISRNSLPVSVLREPSVVRKVLNAVATLLGGGDAAPTVTSRKRAVFYNAVDYAVECKALDSNPIPKVKWSAPDKPTEVDRRTVMNPIQARSFLYQMTQVQRSGARLMAMFAVMYFSALRPEEAVTLQETNLVLPAEGWGELVLETATPHAGKRWTDSGKNRDERQLKHRARGTIRRVPCPPKLTAILHRHIAEFGTGNGGRPFVGERDGDVPQITITRVWAAARAATFTAAVCATPLAKTPHSLRHTAVSTWLNGGVAPPQVAEWAGHSLDVLLKVYAQCIDGQESLARKQIERALGTGPRAVTD